MTGSHIVYKGKKEKNGTSGLNARICPYGSKDKEKEEVRKDSAIPQLDVIRFMLSLTTRVPFRIRLGDIKEAYLRSGPIRGEIYVRPPREGQNKDRGNIWHPTTLPYRITEAGMQWARTIEDGTTNEMGIDRVSGVPQMFVKPGSDSKLIFILVKLTDDLLLPGSRAIMEQFVPEVKIRFHFSKSILHSHMNFKGAKISKGGTGNIQMCIKNT